MNRPGTRPGATRQHRPAARLRLLAAAAAPVALVLGGLAPAAADQAAAHRPAALGAHTARPDAGAAALRAPGLGAASYLVTLITGDQMRLTGADGGRYSVTATAAPRVGGARFPITVTARGGTSGATSVYAVPADAQALISAGLLDTRLFNIGYLASHGDAGPGGRLAVTVQYAGGLSSAALAAKAAALPGASLVATQPARSAVELSVTARQAAAFWAALAGATALTPAAGQHLAGGATRAWLTGDSPPAPPANPRPQAGMPMHAVTVDVTERHSAQPCLAATHATICGFPLALDGVAGSVEGNTYFPDHTYGNCVDTSCTTIRWNFLVPTGIYMVQGFGFFQQDSIFNLVEVVDPQLTVAADASVAFKLDDLQEATVDAPLPTMGYSGVLQDYRTFPDGNWFTDIAFNLASNNYWVTPNQAVTVGTYHFSTHFVLVRPPITMAVKTPERLGLHPVGAATTGPEAFSGTQTLPVVDAGTGTQQDFASLDARGKLALIRIDPSVCEMLGSQLDNAISAGAAGVIADPTNPKTTAGSCLIPAPGDWDFTGATPPPIPWVWITPSDASALRSLLAGGAVQVTVASGGPTPYVYNLKFYQEGSIPGSLHYTVSNDQLATLDTSYHASGRSEYAWQITGVFGPNEYFNGAVSYISNPASVQEFDGPVTPDVVRQVSVLSIDPPDTLESIQASEDAFAQRGLTGTRDWNEQPMTPGISRPAVAAALAQPRFNPFGPCAACRQGDTFFPFVSLDSPDGLTSGNEIPTFGIPGTYHLFQGGREIQPTTIDGIFNTYTLPPQQATYRLTLDTANTSTAWDFSSATPAIDQVPFGYACLGTLLGLSSAPCTPQPLIYLSYHAGVDLANSVTAPGTHVLRISASHEAADAPQVTSLKLWISTDGGSTWQQVPVSAGHGGNFTAVYSVPAPSQTSGTISIKAQARDAAGNDVSQTIDNAFGLVAVSG